MGKTKLDHDPNYVDRPASPKKTKFTPAKSYDKSEDPSVTTWLDERADRIWQLVGSHFRPLQIANTLNKEAKLKKNPENRSLQQMEKCSRKTKTVTS